MFPSRFCCPQKNRCVQTLCFPCLFLFLAPKHFLRVLHQNPISAALPDVQHCCNGRHQAQVAPVQLDYHVVLFQAEHEFHQDVVQYFPQEHQAYSTFLPCTKTATAPLSLTSCLGSLSSYESAPQLQREETRTVRTSCAPLKAIISTLPFCKLMSFQKR